MGIQAPWVGQTPEEYNNERWWIVWYEWYDECEEDGEIKYERHADTIRINAPDYEAAYEKALDELGYDCEIIDITEE